MSFPSQAPRQILLDAVRSRVTPCAVAEVGTAAGPVWQDAVGTLTYEHGAPAATIETVFDLASLTKVIATTTLAMRLVDAGRLQLDERVHTYLPDWTAADRAAVTVADLLEHASGLPAVLPLYEEHAGRAAIQAAICGAPLDYPPRTRSVYSDPGFILLGFLVAELGRAPLDVQFDAMAVELGLARGSGCLRYGPLIAAACATPNASTNIAPTQFDGWRGRLLQGEVDDRNGAALASVAGHTGLFGTVSAVGRFAAAMLAGIEGTANRAPATTPTIRRFLAPSSVPGSSRALGWDRMRPTSSCGTRMSPEAFGHTGFTGTSLWVDPGAASYAVLLTNRVYPSAGSSDGIQSLRRLFHDAVMG